MTADQNSLFKELAKRDAGRMAKQMGDTFEQIFEHACVRKSVAVSRVPNGCRRIGAKKLIPIKSPFDWIITHNTTAVLDTKTIEGDKFPHSKIDHHQVGELLPHELKGAHAGYVIWFRKSNRVMFIRASALATRIRVSGSIKPTDADCLPLGSMNDFDVRKLFKPTIEMALEALNRPDKPNGR